MKKDGFTLVEIVVAFLVMAIVMTAVLQSLGVFISTTQRLSLVRETQREVSFALTRIGDKIRNESVDYNAYKLGGKCALLAAGGITISGTKSEICLGNDFRLEFDNTVDSENIFLWNGDQKGPLFSRFVIVENATFTISPTQDPGIIESLGLSEFQRQPLVDVEFTVKSRRDPSISFDLSTSYSARVYK